MGLSRDELFEALSDGATLITPNARLTKIFSEYYDASRQQSVWIKANIGPFSQWIHQIWSTYAITLGEHQPSYISDQQSDLIWLNLVTAYENSFYNAQALAKKLKQAYEHCLAWQIDPMSEYFDKNDETIFFKNLLQKYLGATPNKKSSIELLSSLLTPLRQQQLVLPTRVIFGFFDDYTPLQKAFINELQANPAIEVTFYDERVSPILCQRVELQSEQEELAQVIAWIKNQLSLGAKNIGVVVPNLQQLRNSFEKTLLSHFKKEAFNISLGKPLIQFPIVNNAIALLSLNRGSISLEQLHQLCHSTFIGGCKQEQQLRYQLYDKLQQTGEKRFALSMIAKHASQGMRLINSLSAFFNKIMGVKTQSLATWVELFIEAFNIIGFPGDRSLSSDEYQVHVRFFQALNEFALLDEARGLYDRNQVLALLKWQLDQLIFQPKAHESSVQFIGLLEALGLQFDALWVMDMSEVQLPKKLNPSAFIPMDLQRLHQMPHASEERELALAKIHIKRLSESAAEVTFSHHQLHEGVHFFASPLIAHLPLKELGDLPKEDNYQDIFEFQDITYEIDKPHEQILKGGSYLIKEQAQCPFRAFSKFQLCLKERRDNMEGLDPLNRGIVIHHVMELFWLKVKTQQQLLQLESNGELAQVSDEVIDQALQNLKQLKPSTCTELFLNIEKLRLQRILGDYLLLEMERPPFKIIHIELGAKFHLNGSELSVRIDRIDELENGDWLVIDYKTGQPSISSLFDERLSEPQLPMYALMEDNIKAIVYGQLQQRAIKNKGISQDDLDIKGVATIEKKQSLTWQEQCQKWHGSISELLQEYLDGNIAPTPNSEVLCTNCQYQTLCGLKR